MRILWRLHGCCARLLTTTCFGTAALNTSFSTAWKPLAQHFDRLSGLFIDVQRNSSFRMHETVENKIDPELYSPHPDVRGMTILDRAAFKKTITVPVLKVKKEIINRLLKSLKHMVLHRAGLKRVIDDPEDEHHKLVLLDPHKMSSEGSLGEADRKILEQFDIIPELAKRDVEFTYDFFKAEEIFQAVLPEGQDVTSGFSRVGHIAHLNLRDHQLPYKHLIGQVIIDKNPGITCVVNKINTIDNTYRNFQMEILAGETNMMTKVKENSIQYEFDFSKVYWNPRLSTEHSRIVDLLKPGDVLFDVFAGVGPFAILAARKKCRVFANDLNPDSYKWLQHNCKLNKVDRTVQVFNMDGRDFLRGPVKEQLTEELSLSVKEKESSLHIVMNLPALAVEFLDVFKHLLDGEPCSSNLLPTVHCYSFSKHDNPAKDIQDRAEAFLGTSLEGRCSVRLVRNVAPNKEMLCISFQVPADVLYKRQCPPEVSPEEPASKRLRPNEDSSEEKSIS
ncbi:PREDICTED: tRNA (guanine(37)-N1)-methyltransferase [Crocodylus porosus]|uniref:tRNA (guanine(37)-N1)-methyltransferase n=1 Tax=Crocodylus porosus TaxID=8502 RepID=A0A7M4G303_CROPO|nr:PREDICTED: tRNA (guanine(37)-N1)-methyltransferase [Crocodylus porosus]